MATAISQKDSTCPQLQSPKFRRRVVRQNPIKPYSVFVACTSDRNSSESLPSLVGYDAFSMKTKYKVANQRYGSMDSGAVAEATQHQEIVRLATVQLGLVDS